MSKLTTSTSDVARETPEAGLPERGGQDSTATAGDTGVATSAADVVRGVTFRIPAGDSRSAALVGDFNGWSHDATPMERHDDSFEVTVQLLEGEYRYRYLLDGVRWENDWNADDYAPNQFGGDDSVRRV